MSNTFVFKPLINPLVPHIRTNAQKINHKKSEVQKKKILFKHYV